MLKGIKISLNAKKLVSLALAGTLILTGCSKIGDKNKTEDSHYKYEQSYQPEIQNKSKEESEKKIPASQQTAPTTTQPRKESQENTSSQTKKEVTTQNEDEYWSENSDMFADPEDTTTKYEDPYWSENPDMFANPEEDEDTKTSDETVTIYYFDNQQSGRMETEPVGTETKNAHDTFEKFESYNLAYRGIEAMDDSFENKYSYTPEDSYQVLTQNFDVVSAINKANSSNASEKKQAELELSIAKQFYQNWLDYNADAILAYEEQKVKSSYTTGETLNISYFDDYQKERIETTPTGSATEDAYKAFELFESYNLAYRAIEEMDDEYQSAYTFTPEERYKLISEGFNIDDAIKKANSNNESERENARKMLIMAKQFYQNWLDYNDDTVINYLELKVK